MSRVARGQPKACIPQLTNQKLMNTKLTIYNKLMMAAAFTCIAQLANAAEPALPSHAQVKLALKNVVTEGDNGGFGFNMWITVVDRDGIVRSVAFSGTDRGDQWPGSRVISAQKANTANAFSLKAFS